MNTKKMGQILKELRGQKSQRVIAEEIGVSQSAINMYERGERIPRDEIKEKLANYYGKSILDIFFID